MFNRIPYLSRTHNVACPSYKLVYNHPRSWSCKPTWLTVGHHIYPIQSHYIPNFVDSPTKLRSPAPHLISLGPRHFPYGPSSLPAAPRALGAPGTGTFRGARRAGGREGKEKVQVVPWRSMANMLQSGGTCAVEENLKMSILVELKEEWSQQTKMVGHSY